MKKVIVLPFWLFVMLWLASLPLPFGAFALSPIAGIVFGTLVPILWLTQMPTSCMGGAFVALPMAMLQLGSALGWLVFGIRFLTA
jgi:hypothetical protein